jgi:hypothetical protein
MELLGDVGKVEAYFGPLRDGVNLDARWVHGLRRMYNRHGNVFSRTRWTYLVMWVN